MAWKRVLADTQVQLQQIKMVDDQQQEALLPLLEGADTDSFVLELPVEGGRTLVCTVRRHTEQSQNQKETVQVLLSFKGPFFGSHEAHRELLLHW